MSRLVVCFIHMSPVYLHSNKLLRESIFHILYRNVIFENFENFQCDLLDYHISIFKCPVLLSLQKETPLYHADGEFYLWLVVSNIIVFNRLLLLAFFILSISFPDMRFYVKWPQANCRPSKMSIHFKILHIFPQNVRKHCLHVCSFFFYSFFMYDHFCVLALCCCFIFIFNSCMLHYNVLIDRNCSSQ